MNNLHPIFQQPWRRSWRQPKPSSSRSAMPSPMARIRSSSTTAPPLQVNHINGCKADNSLENLGWVTASRNRKHAFEIGLQKVSDKQREASRQNIEKWNNRKAS